MFSEHVCCVSQPVSHVVVLIDNDDPTMRNMLAVYVHQDCFHNHYVKVIYQTKLDTLLMKHLSA